jgi:hypothetical protein
VNKVRPLYVLLKAAILYVAVNLAFAFFDPALGNLSVYNWLVRGRERVPYEREVEYYGISHTIPVYEDMDVMYRSTTLSQPKQADEFRVFLLGDSSAWGFQLRPSETLNSQLNGLNLTSCDGRRITVYNAAFPLPYVMKDLLLMDGLLAYEPDMFLWLITLDSFRNRNVFTGHFLDPYSDRVRNLVDRYEIRNLETGRMKDQTPLDRTIIGQRSRLKKVLLLQLHALGWQATGLDYYYQDYQSPPQDQPGDELFFDIVPGQLGLEDQMLFDVLAAGYQLADNIPLLAVNEPIFIASGVNSDVRYNTFYPRWAYDEYLNYLQVWMSEHRAPYLDAWDLLPASEFTDTPFHRSPAGEMILAQFIAPTLLDLSCDK